MIDFTNKIISEEVILKHLLLTMASKVQRGLCPIKCAKVAHEEIVAGIMIPYIREMDNLMCAS